MSASSSHFSFGFTVNFNAAMSVDIGCFVSCHPNVMTPDDGNPIDTLVCGDRLLDFLIRMETAYPGLTDEFDDGCRWLPVDGGPVSDRAAYMNALERASVGGDVAPFADFLAGLTKHGLDGDPLPPISLRP